MCARALGRVNVCVHVLECARQLVVARLMSNKKYVGLSLPSM